MAKHTCCVSDTWFISLDEKEIEDTLGMRLNQYSLDEKEIEETLGMRLNQYNLDKKKIEDI